MDERCFKSKIEKKMSLLEIKNLNIIGKEYTNIYSHKYYDVEQGYTIIQTKHYNNGQMVEYYMDIDENGKCVKKEFPEYLKCSDLVLKEWSEH